MKKKKIALITMLVATTMVISSALVGCGSKTTTGTNTPAGTTKTTTTAEDNTKPATPKNNTDKVFRDLGGWPKPPLYQGNPKASVGVGEAWGRVFEGLYVVVRSTDKVINVLAESEEDQGTKTIVHIRKGVTWNDGQPFTSKDVWCKYMVDNGCEVLKYLDSIETPDENTVVFNWSDPAPYPELKKWLIAQDTQGEIPDHLFHKWAQQAEDLIKKGTKVGKDDPSRSTFGLKFDDATRKALDANWQDFIKQDPSKGKPVGTGPYTVDTVTATDMILVKRKDYWNADKVNFDKLWFKQVPDSSAQYALLKSGKLDFMDGTPPKDILESMLAANKDLVHYRMFDPACPGMFYNTRKAPFNDIKFRQAISYVYDKSKLREVGNYYGQEHPEISVAGIPSNMLKDWILPEAKMKDYTHNEDTATKMLQDAGWTKGSDGVWKDKSGKSYEFIIGAPAGWINGVNPAQVAAEQLTKFGLPTKMKAVDGSVYYSNADKGEYDMSVDWSDVDWGFNDPWNCLRNSYWWGPMTKIGFPKDAKGNLDLKIAGPDGKIVDVDATMKAYPYEQDPAKRKKMISDLCWIYNENAWGCNFYQNATGTWINSKFIGGQLPMAADIQKYNRDMPAPTETNDRERVAETNLGFCYDQVFMDGTYWPK